MCALPANVLMLKGYWPIVGTAVAIARKDGAITVLAPKDEEEHPTGHGVGFAAIDHNALPRLHPRSPDLLQEGMVFNVEPGIYLQDQAMRHCDMVAVTHDGCELLTPFQQDVASLAMRP